MLSLRPGVYEPPYTDEESDDEDFHSNVDPSRHIQILAFRITDAISLLCNVLSVVWLVHQAHLRATSWRGTLPMHSPVNATIVHERQRFPFSLEQSIDRSNFDGDVDAAWNALYNEPTHLVNLAKTGTNETARFHDFQEDSSYLVSLGIYHQMHCLDTIRRSAWLERSSQPRNERYDHSSIGLFNSIDRCRNSLRRSISCKIDIRRDIWLFNHVNHASGVRFDVVHPCRNFDAIRQRKREHRNLSHLNGTNTDGTPIRPRISWEEFVNGGLAYIAKAQDARGGWNFN